MKLIIMIDANYHVTLFSQIKVAKRPCIFINPKSMHLNCKNNEFFKHDQSSSGVKERTLVFIAHSFAASLEPANWLSNSRVLNSRDKCALKMQTYINVCSCYSFSLDCQLILWFIIYILGKKKKIPWTVQFWSFGQSHNNHLHFYWC